MNEQTHYIPHLRLRQPLPLPRSLQHEDEQRCSEEGEDDEEEGGDGGVEEEGVRGEESRDPEEPRGDEEQVSRDLRWLICPESK